VRTLERTALLEVTPSVAYAVVVDVMRYPEFVPGCKAVEVLETSDHGLVAKVAVAGRGLHETFVTSNRHMLHESVVMSLREGPFERLEGQWRFTPLGEVGCRVDLRIEYQPKGMLTRLLSPIADRVANKLVDAFSERIAGQANAG
jgi:ribosome-associated toxin RatA of RatAB toxin-antitoxin module